MVETVVTQEKRVVFSPLRIYEHACQGLLFSSGSINGRSTTIFCMLDPKDAGRKLALKMSWQDLERVSDHVVVIKRLKETSRPNIVVPLENFHAEREGQMCTTLGAIRGFLEEQIALLKIENRVLNISTSELKRPVKYFWGIHDFVRGLRGALLGHQFLTSIGILHRDISENNIVLGVYPWEERGYLIDFDMAIMQDVEESTQVPPNQYTSPHRQSAEQSTSRPVRTGETKHVKALRMVDVILPLVYGHLLIITRAPSHTFHSTCYWARHTHFDDVESFLYVLLLFFFSYAGPLSKEDLQDAHANGFARPIGSRRLPHMRRWPQHFCDWADGNSKTIGRLKAFFVWSPNGLKYLEESDEIADCLRNNWAEDLEFPIRALLRDILTAFRDSTNVTPGKRTEVSHTQFINILNQWLLEYSELEDKHSNCPDFKDFRNNE